MDEIPSKEKGVSHGTNHKDELQLEATFGIHQEMKRNFSLWSLLFMCCCTSTTWEALASTMTQALSSGGSSSMVWGFFVSAIGAFLLSLCLGEFSSRIPTAGGQYHYAAELCPPKARRVVSWFAGWNTLWGWILITLAGNFANAMQLQAYLILFAPGYEHERWHTSLILIALTTLYLAGTSISNKVLYYTTFWGITFHIIGYFLTIIYLLVSVKEKQTAKWVFTDQTNYSGWNSGIAWSIGIMSSALSQIGWDASTHMSEEMKDAARDLPRTMYGAVLITGLTTFPWVIALMFCMEDIGSVVNGPAGAMSPLVQLIYNVSGGNMAVTLGVTIPTLALNVVSAGPACLAATSRLTWSFAREGGLPSFLAKIHPKLNLPLNAIMFDWLLVTLLSLIYIGNETAFYGLNSGVTVVVILSYALPIFLHIVYGTQHCNLPAGPFTLGKLSIPINYVALIWATYLIIFLSFPSRLPVTAVNMNYTCLVLAAGIVIPAGLWFAYGNNRYLGVVHEVSGSREASNLSHHPEVHYADAKAAEYIENNNLKSEIS
ncbi:Amino acid/polyamine transporter I [Penicillium mononematosum]|uniref:Amino acid/polyamine transporter I n=1 Tax=Penicillium mononematosum TaxID=268346 RepID=UPI002546DEC3|nr:Amino acid/polyamine transporter I [Penicillium mononematosum]KAJ6186507.1 Amino acid/polyamine transporter I [Penicillium mononematosum]